MRLRATIGSSQDSLSTLNYLTQNNTGDTSPCYFPREFAPFKATLLAIAIRKATSSLNFFQRNRITLCSDRLLAGHFLR